MKKIIAFMLILSILICAVSCTDRVHMDDITDEYERNIYTADPGAQIGDAVMVAEGIPYSEMLDLLEQHIAVDLDFDFPCEGEFITEDGKKCISRVGVCNVYYYPPESYWIKFRLRIFDSKGYLIVEDDIVAQRGVSENDCDSWKWSSLGPETLKYWKKIATTSD